MPNHPPLPAAEKVSPAVLSEADCETLKLKFGIETATHAENSSKSHRLYQSHHAIQDRQLESHVGREVAQAVLLVNSHRGTEHGVITKRQNKRKNDKVRHRDKGIRRGPHPASTYGGLKEQAKEDLLEGFRHSERTDASGNKMTPDEQEQLAECITTEADNQAKKEHRKSENEKKGADPDYEPKQLSDDTPVFDWGCFPAWTKIWLNDGSIVRADRLKVGHPITSSHERAQVTRIETCINRLVRLVLETSQVELAPMHRVRLATGKMVCAHALRSGQNLATVNGPVRLVSVETMNEPHTVYSFGVGKRGEHAIGDLGLWVELRHTGVAQRPDKLPTTATATT